MLLYCAPLQKLIINIVFYIGNIASDWKVFCSKLVFDGIARDITSRRDSLRPHWYSADVYFRALTIS